MNILVSFSHEDISVEESNALTDLTRQLESILNIQPRFSLRQRASREKAGDLVSAIEIADLAISGIGVFISILCAWNAFHSRNSVSITIGNKTFTRVGISSSDFKQQLTQELTHTSPSRMDVKIERNQI